MVILSKFAVFQADWQFFHIGYGFFCGKLAGLFWFVYKIKPLLYGHVVHTLQVIGRTAENNYIYPPQKVSYPL